MGGLSNGRDVCATEGGSGGALWCPLLLEAAHLGIFLQVRHTQASYTFGMCTIAR